MGLSRIFIWLWPINGRKHEYLGPIQLDYYSPYSSKMQVLDSTPSRLLGHYSVYYSTPSNGRISNIFWIARRGRVIRQSLFGTKILGVDHYTTTPTLAFILIKFWSGRNAIKYCNIPFGQILNRFQQSKKDLYSVFII